MLDSGISPEEVAEATSPKIKNSKTKEYRKEKKMEIANKIYEDSAVKAGLDLSKKDGKPRKIEF